jgi:hypothetical protein
MCSPPTSNPTGVVLSGAYLRPLDQNVAALGDRFARDAVGHSLYIKPLFGTRSASRAFTLSDG